MTEKNTIWKIDQITTEINSLLKYKNKNYGDSALNTLGVFCKNNAEDGILRRLDDKLSRIKNSEQLRKNDIADVMGYLILLCAEKDWISFEELKD